MASIRKSFDWLARVFDVRGPQRSPNAISDDFQATVDTFGSHKIAEVENFFVTGALGGTEAVSGPVPDGFWWHVLSMTFIHDDPAGQFLVPIRIVPFLGVFPQQPFRPDQFQPALVEIAVRNVAVPPRAFIGARTLAMGAGARILVAGLRVELPLGEYPNWGPEGGA